jgi:molecular chaperone IbpA
MRTSDLTPYRRSTVGFDRLFDLLENQAAADAGDGFPPFDLEREGEDNYRITVAAAGFGPNEIEIVAQQNLLTIKGNKAPERADRSFLHRGIATRSFERRFQLADFVQVQSASFENGLLHIALRREVPETMKPRKIEIGAPRADDERERRTIEKAEPA